MDKNNFLEQIIHAVERAKNPIVVGGILCVLLVGYLLFNRRQRHKTIRGILYGVLIIAGISVIAGIYLMIKPASKVIYGQLFYQCEPAKETSVSILKIKDTKTDGSGRFHFDISGVEFTELNFTFQLGNKMLGQRKVAIDTIENEIEFYLGECSDSISIEFKGRVYKPSGRDGLVAEVRLKGYDSLKKLTDENGYFSLKGTILKSDTNNMKLLVSSSGYPLSEKNIDMLNLRDIIIILKK